MTGKVDLRPPGPAVAQVKDLEVTFRRRRRPVKALRGVSLDIARGEVVAVVGESGSGKTVMGLSLLGLLPSHPGPRVDGTVSVVGTDMLKAPERLRRDARRRHLGAVFQDPMSSLNPSMRVGRQIVEAAPHADAVALLERVGLDRAAERAHAYPHELSGGQRQRVMIAIAVARKPALVVADEPTTALDVTVQAQILGLIRELRADVGCSFLFITHDLAVAAEIADRVVVMYAGRVVESGTVSDVVRAPRHPYTVALLGARLSLVSDRHQPLPSLPGTVPTGDEPLPGCSFAPRCPLRVDACEHRPPPLVQIEEDHAVACIRAGEVAEAGTLGARSAAQASGRATLGTDHRTRVELVGVSKTFSQRSGRGGRTSALSAVDLSVAAGEAVAVVGESGSGKSTLLRIVAGLTTPESGTVRGAGRGQVQMVFQDAASSLTPWLTVRSLVGERLRAAGLSRRDVTARIDQTLTLVGLRADLAEARPRQLSGGQAQRVAIARAIAVPPAVLLADEPTSALDVSVAATVLNLLGDLRRRLGFSMLFVTHDLAVARLVADRIVVMLRGSIVEEGTPDAVVHQPQHPYTRALIEAVPGTRAIAEAGAKAGAVSAAWPDDGPRP